MKLKYDEKVKDWVQINKISEPERLKILAQEIAAEKAKAKEREEKAAKEWLAKNPPPKPKPQPIKAVAKPKKEKKRHGEVEKR